jgi:hypothetical protein
MTPPSDSGGLSVVCNLLQFGWFVDHVFGVFAAPGTLLQALWFAGPAALAGASARDHPPVKDPLALHRCSREWPRPSDCGPPSTARVQR